MTLPRNPKNKAARTCKALANVKNYHRGQQHTKRETDTLLFSFKIVVVFSHHSPNKVCFSPNSHNCWPLCFASPLKFAFSFVRFCSVYVEHARSKVQVKSAPKSIASSVFCALFTCFFSQRPRHSDDCIKSFTINLDNLWSLRERRVKLHDILILLLSCCARDSISQKKKLRNVKRCIKDRGFKEISFGNFLRETQMWHVVQKYFQQISFKTSLIEFLHQKRE